MIRSRACDNKQKFVDVRQLFENGQSKAAPVGTGSVSGAQQMLSHIYSANV
jgi:hypothetical protein